MSTPLTSTGPTSPEQSSQGVPVGGFRQWFVYIINWIKGLSPTGATQYDTDWVALSPTSGHVAGTPAPQWRRIGRTYYFRGVIQPVSGEFAPGAAYTLTESVPGFTSAAADTVRTAYGPSGSDPLRIWLQSGAVTVYPKSSASYVALSALSGQVTD